MSKKEFSKGVIVRRKIIEREQVVGPYMRVEVANAHYVYAKVINCKDITMLTREHVHKVSVIELCVSYKTMDRIKNGQYVISHEASKNWTKVCDERPELVEFYTSDGYDKVWCTIDEAFRYLSERRPRVKIIINNIIDQQFLI